MKNLQTFDEFLNESQSVKDVAYLKIESLPKGKIFDDAKVISGVFKMSKHSWNEVIVAYEKHEEEHHIKVIDVDSIRITQPNIQSGKVIKMMEHVGSLPVINAVKFPNGEIAIYDGHHRLMAHWALGINKIKINLVTL